jgi:hypothetical protein
VIQTDSGKREIVPEPPSIVFIGTSAVADSSTSSSSGMPSSSSNNSGGSPSQQRGFLRPSSTSSRSPSLRGGAGFPPPQGSTLQKSTMQLLAFYPHAGQVISSRLEAKEDVDIASNAISGLSQLMRGATAGMGVSGSAGSGASSESRPRQFGVLVRPVAEWRVAREEGWAEVKRDLGRAISGELGRRGSEVERGGDATK